MKCRSRNKAWLGAAITAAAQIAGAGINYFQQQKANKKQLQQQYMSDILEMQNNIGENANNDLNNYYDRVELIPQFPYGGNTNLKPNIVRGGHAIDLGNNLYLMSGRKHSQGGIDIGKNPKTGIEVEGNEVVQTTPSSLRVFSAQPILGGISPAEYILGGANPNKVFAAQENWKRINNINDDGTRKAKFGKQNKNKGYIDENDKDFIGPRTPEKVKTKNDVSKFYKNTFNNIASKYEDKYPNYAYFLRKAGEYYGDRMGENESNLIRYDNPEDIINIKGTKSSNVPVPKALLDSLALNGAKTKVAPYIALGLANQESRFGYYPSAFYDARAMNAQREAIPEGEAMNSGAVTPIEILNDAAYGNNPYIDTLSYVAKKHKVGYLYNDSVQLPKLDLDDATLQKLEEDFIKGRKYADKMAAKFTKSGSVFEHAFNLYKSGKYNPGDSNYSSMVENAGRDAFSSPQIQEWWNKYGKKYYEQYAPDLVNSFEYGGIHIKPSKRGTFTAAAKKHGMGVQAFASKVLANKDDYSPAMVKKANFARNASKWNHKEFGGNMDFNYIIGKNNIYKLGGRRKAPTGLGIYFPTTQDLHKGILYDRDGNPLFDTEINPSSVVADRIPARTINGILYDENGNAKFDTDIEPSIVVADRVNKTPDLTSINKETDNYIENLNLDDDINVPYETLDLDSDLTVRPMKYRKRDRGYRSKDIRAGRVEFDREEKDKVANPNRRIGSDEIGLGINLLGNLASSLINNATINSLDYGNAPIPLRAVKLKTRYNINPQLDNIREEVARGENDVTQNTASSKVALSRRQSLRGRGLQYANQLEGQKENIETELINRDRLNQQQVGNRNVERFDTWYRGLVDFENNRRNLKAENAVAGINNATDAIAGPQGYMARRERRLDNDIKLNRDLLDLKVLSLLNPNAKGILDPEIKEAFDEYERLLRRRRGTII